MGSKARMMEASRVIDAPAQRIFAFLARPGNHVLLDTSGMIRGSAGHVTVTRTGTVFLMNMHNQTKGGHQVENRVVIGSSCIPAVVVGGEPFDQRGDLGADWRPSRPVGIGPLPGDQGAVPAQDGAGGDQPVYPQPCRQEPDQRGEDCAVGPVEPGPRMGAAQHGDFVPQHEQLGVLGG
jgi:hypothetical protein